MSVVRRKKKSEGLPSPCDQGGADALVAIQKVNDKEKAEKNGIKSTQNDRRNEHGGNTQGEVSNKEDATSGPNVNAVATINNIQYKEGPSGNNNTTMEVGKSEVEATKTSSSFPESETELQRKYAAARAMYELAAGVFITRGEGAPSGPPETTTASPTTTTSKRGIPGRHHHHSPPPPLQHHRTTPPTTTTTTSPTGLGVAGSSELVQNGSGSAADLTSTTEEYTNTASGVLPLTFKRSSCDVTDAVMTSQTTSQIERELAMSYSVQDGIQEGIRGGVGGLGKSTTTALRYQFHSASPYHHHHQHHPEHHFSQQHHSAGTTSSHGGDSPVLSTLRVGSQITAFPLGPGGDPRPHSGGSRVIIMRRHSSNNSQLGGGGGGAINPPCVIDNINNNITNTPLSPGGVNTTVPSHMAAYYSTSKDLPSPHSTAPGASGGGVGGGGGRNESAAPLHHHSHHHHHHHHRQVEMRPGPLSLVKTEKSPLSPAILTSPLLQPKDSEGIWGGGGVARDIRGGPSMQGGVENLCVRDAPPRKAPTRALPLKKRKYVENRTSDVTASADDVMTSSHHVTPKQVRRDVMPPGVEYVYVKRENHSGYEQVLQSVHTGPKVSKELSNSSIQYLGSVHKSTIPPHHEDQGSNSNSQPLDFSASSTSNRHNPALLKTERTSQSLDEKKMNNLSQIVHKLSAQHHREADSKEIGVQIRKMAQAAFVAAPPPPKKTPRPLDLTSRKSHKNTDSREPPRGKKRGNVRRKTETVVISRAGSGPGQTEVKAEEGSVQGQTVLGEVRGSGEGSGPPETTEGSQQEVVPDGGGAAEPKDDTPSRADEPLPINPTDSLRMLHECKLAIKPDEDGDLPLHIAVVQGNEETIDKLIQMMAMSNVTIDYCNHLRQTPLHLAIITKQPTITRTLLSHGACPDYPDRGGNTAVHLAVQHQTLPCLRVLTERVRRKPNLNTKNYDGLAPIHVAVQMGDTEMVRALLQAQASIDITDGKSGRTALHHASENRQIKLVELLLKHHSKVNVQSYAGNTALHTASERSYKDIMTLLVQYGADTTIKNANHETYNTVAKDSKQSAIIRENGISYPPPGRIPRAPVSNDVNSLPAKKAGQKRGRTPRILSHPQVKVEEPSTPSPTFILGSPSLLTVQSPRRSTSKSPKLTDGAPVQIGREMVWSPKATSPEDLNLQNEQLNQGSRIISRPTSLPNQTIKLPSPLTPSPTPQSPVSPLVNASTIRLHSPKHLPRSPSATFSSVIPSTVMTCDGNESKLNARTGETTESQPIVFVPRPAGYPMEAKHIEVIGDRRIIQKCGSPAPIHSLKTMVKSLNSDQQTRKVKVTQTVQLPVKIAEVAKKEEMPITIDNRTSVVQPTIRYAMATSKQEGNPPKTSESIRRSILTSEEKGILDRYQTDKVSMKSFLETLTSLQRSQSVSQGGQPGPNYAETGSVKTVTEELVQDTQASCSTTSRTSPVTTSPATIQIQPEEQPLSKECNVKLQSPKETIKSGILNEDTGEFCNPDQMTVNDSKLASINIATGNTKQENDKTKTHVVDTSTAQEVSTNRSAGETKPSEESIDTHASSLSEGLKGPKVAKVLDSNLTKDKRAANIDHSLLPEPTSPDFFQPLVICESEDDTAEVKRSKKTKVAGISAEKDIPPPNPLAKETLNSPLPIGSNCTGDECKSLVSDVNVENVPRESDKKKVDEILPACDPKAIVTYKNHPGDSRQSESSSPKLQIIHQNGTSDGKDPETETLPEPAGATPEKNDSEKPVR